MTTNSVKEITRPKEGQGNIRLEPGLASLSVPAEAVGIKNMQ
jgi:hypothetical protein